MKKTAAFILGLCLIAAAAFAAQPKTDKTADEKSAAGKIVADFLKSMDEKKYDAAFAQLDFEMLIKDQSKTDISKLKPKDRERQIKTYQEMIKGIFENEKKQTKFRNFSQGAFKKTGDTATLDIVNTPPKGTPGKPTVKTFKLILKNKTWKIFGFAQQPAK